MDIVLDTRFNNPVLPRDLPDDLLLVSDNFARPDGNALGQTPIGEFPWIVISNGVSGAVGSIVNGAAQVAAVGGNDRAAAVVNAGRSDVYFEARMLNAPFANYMGLVFRVKDMSNMLFLVAETGPGGVGFRWALYKRVANVSTRIVTTTTEVLINDLVAVETRGTRIRVYINNVLATEQSVTDFVTETRFGIYGGGATIVPTPMRYDDISLIVRGEWLLPVENVYDDFNRADSISLGVAPTGETWQVMNSLGTTDSPMAIVANQARGRNLGGSANTGISYIDKGASDGILQATVGVAHSNTRFAFRIVDARNYWQVMFGSTGTIELRRYANNTSVRTVTAPGGTPQDGIITIELTGPSIVVKRNGAQIIAISDATDYVTATKHGLLMLTHASGSGTWDDFSFLPAA